MSYDPLMNGEDFMDFVNMDANETTGDFIAEKVLGTLKRTVAENRQIDEEELH